MKDIYFLGDCFFKTTNNKNPFSIINAELMNNFVVCNFETSVYEKYEKNDDKFVQLGIQADKIAEGSIDNIDVFNLANNHTFDFGEEGLQNTIRFLTEREKKLIGIQDFAYYITEIYGTTIGFVGCIAYSGIRRERYINEKNAISIIEKIKNRCEFIILNVHWGTEYADYPSPFQRRLSRKFIKAGADLIVGHHPHVIQGYEEISNKLVYYSLGNCNFFYQEYLSKFSKFSLILKIKLKNKLKIKEKFYKIDETYSLDKLNHFETKKISNHFFSISNNNLKKSWIQWGKLSAPIFLKKERISLRNRFKRGTVRQYLIFFYWLTRKKTIFLLFCFFLYLIGRNYNE